MTRINDDRLEAHCLFSPRGKGEGGLKRSEHRVVSMGSVLYHYQVDHLSLACLLWCLPHSLGMMAPRVNLHTRLLFDNGCAEWVFSGHVNQKCGHE